MTHSENEIQSQIIRAIGAIPGLLVLRNQVGRYCENGRWITYGLGVGSPDLVCIYHGRVIGLEVKTALGKLRPEQIRCHNAWRACGALVFTVRSPQEALDAISGLV